MPATWPAFLQDKLNQAGFSYEAGNNVLRSDNDQGPAKVRATSTKRVDKFSCSVDLPIENFDDWDNFFTVSLANGTNTFYFNHPFTQVQSIFRFSGSPRIDPLGGTEFRLSMTWELLP